MYRSVPFGHGPRGLMGACADASSLRAGSLLLTAAAPGLSGSVKINLQEEFRIGKLSLLLDYWVPPPPPPPSILRIIGLGMVWRAKSRCQRTYRSKSRKHRSYGRSLALLLRVSPSRSRCYCLNDYERNRKRAQGQMSQGGCGKPACTSRDWVPTRLFS